MEEGSETEISEVDQVSTTSLDSSDDLFEDDASVPRTSSSDRTFAMRSLSTFAALRHGEYAKAQALPFDHYLARRSQHEADVNMKRTRSVRSQVASLDLRLYGIPNLSPYPRAFVGRI